MTQTQIGLRAQLSTAATYVADEAGQRNDSTFAASISGDSLTFTVKFDSRYDGRYVLAGAKIASPSPELSLAEFVALLTTAYTEVQTLNFDEHMSDPMIVDFIPSDTEYSINAVIWLPSTRVTTVATLYFDSITFTPVQ